MQIILKMGSRQIARTVLLVLTYLLCASSQTSWSLASSPSIAGLLPLLSVPIVQILHPSNEFLLEPTDLHVRIKIRDDLFEVTQESRICISMHPVYVPDDVLLENGTSELKQRCFGHAEASNFHVAGLVPGLSYSLSAGLTRGGKVVGVSTRSFQVASIFFAEISSRMSIAAALEKGVQYHQADDRTAAADIYQRVIELFPDHLHALHLLGLAIYQEGRALEALPYIRRAAEGNSSEVNFQNSLGLCWKALDEPLEAIKYFRRALQLDPSFVQAAMNLGDAWHSIGKWEESMQEYRKVITALVAIEHEPGKQKLLKDAIGRMCELLRVTNGWYEADRCLKEALSKWPQEATFHNDRGNLMLQAGQFDAALKEYQSAADVGSLYGMINVAGVMEAIGNTAASLELYDQLANNSNVGLSSSLGRVLMMRATVLPRILPQSQVEIDSYRDRFEVEIDALQANSERLRPLELDPSRITLSTAVTLNGHNRNNRIIKGKLGALYYDLLHDKQIVEEEYSLSYGIVPHPVYQRRKLAPDRLAIGPRRLRIGFVSRFIFNRMAGLFMDELIPLFDNNKFDVTVFGIGQSRSMKVIEHADQIADYVVALPRDLRFAREELTSQKLDLIIYPELGMDKTTFMLSFSRLAPIQAVWWGNPDTSGVPTIDYRLTSEYEHENHSSHYTEKTFQLRGLGFFHRLDQLPTTNVTREEVRRSIEERFDIPSDFRLYLSIESILHIHPDFDKAVAGILRKDHRAHIFLLAASTRKTWQEKILARIISIAGEELASKRIFIFNDVDYKQELLLAHTADAVLGNLHLTRPLTALQALAVGAPIVTMPGELWGSRIIYALYQELGINDLIANSTENYVDLAVRLASNDKFHRRISIKIQNRKSRLSESIRVVREWEKFFYFASSRLFPVGDSFKESDEPDSQSTCSMQLQSHFLLHPT